MNVIVICLLDENERHLIKELILDSEITIDDMIYNASSVKRNGCKWFLG